MIKIKTKQKILKILKGSKEPIGLHEIYELLGGKVSNSNLCHHLNRLKVERKIKSSVDIKHNKKYEVVNPLMIILLENIDKYGEFNNKEFQASIIDKKYKEDWYNFYKFLRCNIKVGVVEDVPK